MKLAESQRQLHSYKAELSKAQQKLRQFAGAVQGRADAVINESGDRGLRNAAPKLHEAIHSAFVEAQTATVVAKVAAADMGDAAF